MCSFRRLAYLATTVLLLSIGGTANVPAANDFFTGKTITILIGFGTTSGVAAESYTRSSYKR